MQEPQLEQIEDWTLQIGVEIAEMQNQDLEPAHKGEADLVTRADKTSEAFLIGKIRSAFPSHSIVAEESGSHSGDPEHQWYIDPLDGTLNYAHGLPIYSISIGYAYRGQLQLGVIYAPALKECFSAAAGKGAWLNGKPIRVSQTAQLIDAMMVTGFRHSLLDTPRSNIQNFERVNRACQTVRRLGSAALDLAYVACGRKDGFWEIALYSWDVAAGILIAREAGAIVEHMHPQGDLLAPIVDIVAANPVLFPAFRTLISDGL